jgi:hypothetical protein
MFNSRARSGGMSEVLSVTTFTVIEGFLNLPFAIFYFDIYAGARSGLKLDFGIRIA